MNLKRSLGLISLLLILTVTFSACSSSDEELKAGDGEAALEVGVQRTQLQSNLLQSVTGDLKDKIAINKLELTVYQADEYQSEGSNAEVVDSVTKEVTGLDNLESQAFYVPNGQSYVIAAQLSGTVDGEVESNIYRGVSEPTGVLEDATTSPVTVNVSFKSAEQLEIVIDGIPQQVGAKDVAQMNVELSNPILGRAEKTITEASTVSFNNDDLELRPAMVQVDIQLQDSNGQDIPAGGEFGGEIQLLPGQKQQLSVDQQPYLEVDSSSVEVDETGTLNFTVVGTDPEGAEVSLEVVSETKPSGATFNAETGEFSWQPDESDQGTYQVKFRAQAGSKSNYEVVTIQVNDKLEISVNREQSPSAPTGVTGSYNSGAITLSVDNPTSEANYMIYRSTTNDPATAEPVSDGLVDLAGWEDSNLTGLNTYYYWVRSYNQQGLSSSLSSVVKRIAAYKIDSIEDLVKVGRTEEWAADEDYKLVADLDFNSDGSYEDPSTTEFGDLNGDGTTDGLKTEVTTSSGWQPIPSSFNGQFMGNNQQLANLYLDRDADNQGLFAKLGQGAVVEDLTIDTVDMKTASKTGVLAGEAVEAGITNCMVKNAAVDIYRTNETSEFSDNMYKGQSFIGGLVGMTKDTRIANASLFNLELMKDSLFTKEDKVSSSRLGGLVGIANGGQIEDSTVTDASITGKEDQTTGDKHIIAYAGGLIGEVANESTEEMVVDNCEVENITLAVGNSAAYSGEPDTSKSGGLIGAVADPKTEFVTKGDIAIKDSSAAGTIDKGAIVAYDAISAVGGFVGVVDGNKTPTGIISITNSEADVEIKGLFEEKQYLDVYLTHASENGGIGGFAGRLSATEVKGCSATGYLKGELGGKMNIWAGGFAGVIDNSRIATSFATGNVTGFGLSGFAYQVKDTQISESYATGNVNSQRGTKFGEAGFVSLIQGGSINNCYSTGNVKDGFFEVAGFVGTVKEAEVKHCYTTGKVLLDLAQGSKAFGFVKEAGGAGVQDSIAFNSEIINFGSQTTRFGPGTLENNYANENMYIESNGEDMSDQYPADLNSHWGADMTQEEFASQSFYTNPDNWIEPWDFDDVWEIKPGDTRPTLQELPD
ncbi:GLUG motif-containing protein [Halanaerobacter jeridensis]|uniref:Fibronectin type-III domain-containing protein n=1 Tax=Halanaerobacter jeridensis TaxID=706427 RepID=A0A939BSF0_9FIRM|nr:Ig domain-containing protein [Halanaerobacter jeridensis]MBM7557076.1 hypothetical protein [Halanaerobacter jeridensis]